MHLVTFPISIDMGNAGIFPKGQLLMEDKNAAEMILQWPKAGITMTPFEKDTIRYPSYDKILVAGGLGMGDAIMLTPVLRALKIKFPDIPLEVGCFPRQRQALLNLPYIDGFPDWPLRVDYPESLRLNKNYFLENFLDHPLAKTHHMTDVFAAICDVELTDRTADYKPTEDEISWVIRTFPREPGLKRIGMQVQASHRCRTYPAELLRDLMQILIKDGWEVYLMGEPHEFQCQEMGHLHDLRIQAPTFRESAAFLTTCDAFVGPDSGFLHAAGAMNIPSVGLFGAFHWKLRTAHYPSEFAIQGSGDCSPCFYSPTRLQPQFPSHGPCARTGRCEVLAAIDPERIKALIERQAFNVSLVLPAVK